MKKFISVFLMVVLVISSIVFAEDVPSKKQLEDLKSLGIMVGDEDGNMRLDDTITRAEAAKMICTVMGVKRSDFISEVAISAFPDVTDSHWAKFYINEAKVLGIVEGDENGNFNPESDITNEEILKMLIFSMGYAPMAEQTGGYPAGYLRTAQKTGITENLVLKVDSPAVRKDVAVMFAMALDIPMMVQSSWSPSGAVSYQILDGNNGIKLETLRTRFFGDK